MKKYIGCDLGGTNLRAAIVDVETGDVLHHMSIPTLARDGHEAVMGRMADLITWPIIRAISVILSFSSSMRTQTRVLPFISFFLTEK